MLTSCRRVVQTALLALFIGSAGSHVRAAEDAPYESGLLRLAELLGSIHYLRALCGAEDGSIWRDQMSALVEAEGDDDARRHKLVASFNRGYRSFASVYRECTPSARQAVEGYVAEGAALANDITARYGR